MAHLYIHGIPVECSASEYQPVRLGEVVRSLNGAPRTTARARKRDYRFTTDQGGLLLEDAELLRALIEGEGHSWNFEEQSLNSSRALLPIASADYEIAPDEGKHGAYGLRVFSLTGFVQWDLTPDASWDWTEWTLMAWLALSEPANYSHYIITSGGTCWKDGVIATAPAELVLAASGILTVGSGDEILVDDLVALPYVVPAEWVPYLEDFCADEEWPGLPLVRATGPGVQAPGLTTVGQAGAARRVPMREEDGNFTTGEVFDFTLSGV
ncbi:hypothetical protein [Hyalangium sp.]|uniref:hypothetical protein n=1 Tax=Hyalangium sp. TaxID=2028555 RepID=UPI002D3D3B94|nr:hypothetical protein [Hyalangium sp.]HYH96173.1 hypothetical protein [Hyalangium sp.]